MVCVRIGAIYQNKQNPGEFVAQGYMATRKWSLNWNPRRVTLELTLITLKPFPGTTVVNRERKTPSEQARASTAQARDGGRRGCLPASLNQCLPYGMEIVRNHLEG